MKSLQADFFKVMKEGAIQYAAPLPFLDLVCVGTATQTEVEEQKPKRKARSVKM